MAIDAASKLLSTRQVAMLPTHDPLVGRVVGTVLQYQGPKAVLKGKIDGSDPIDLTYAKAADGTITCDGFFGSIEIHEKLASTTTGSSGGSNLFGIAGDTTKTQAATASGTVGSYNEVVGFTVERHTQEVALTDELRGHGTSTMTMSSQVLSSPSFGGGQVKTYLEPGHLPEESPALQTQDAINVKGNCAGTGVSRQFQWNMTTWSKNSNDLEGWAHTEMWQAEDASESESFQSGDERTYTPAPIEWHVTPFHAIATGTLVTEQPQQAPLSRSVRREYQMDMKTGAFHVHEAFGDTRIDFDISKG